MRTVLVTGASGFIGAPFVQAIQRDFEVLTPHLSLPDDLFELESLKDKRVDAVFHLAGMSSVTECDANPAKAFSVNTVGTYLLARKVAELWPQAVFYFASTAQVYAASTEGRPIREDSAIGPQNLYAETKWLAETELRDLAARKGLGLVILRLFNHAHRSQAPSFFLPSLYRQIETQRAVGNDPIEIAVGNLDVERDIGALTDVVEALRAMALDRRLAPRGEVFNLCSGTSKNLRDLANELARAMKVNVEFKTDARRVRVGEAKLILGDCSKFRARYDWAPKAGTVQELTERFLR